MPNGVHGWKFRSQNSPVTNTGWGNLGYIDNYGYLPVTTIKEVEKVIYRLRQR